VLDVVTLGEAMIRLAAPFGDALESAPHYEVRAAGAEANVAVALARVGFRSGWVSKLAADPLGRRIAGEMRRHGVDVTSVVWVPAGRNGVYYLEQAPPPRGVTVFYDRAGSATSSLRPDEIDWAYVRGARWAHITGITPALSETCAAVTARFIAEAHAGGAQVSFDVNHRRKLWTAERARSVLTPLIAGVDLVIVGREDLREVFGIEGPPAETAALTREQLGARLAAVTAGADGAYLADERGVHHEPGVQAGELDPIGRGDAFAAGLLWGALEGDLNAGLRYGVALAALTQTYWGDVPWATRQDVLAALAGRGAKPAR
jgi:2-dehydro-3-deoxygluconokinase